MTSKNTMRDNRREMLNVIFSPASDGRKNTAHVRKEKSIVGNSMFVTR